MNPPYRADHIGSFLRPSELLEARKNASRDELQALEDQQIRRIPAIAFKRGVTDRAYPDPSALLWDVVEIMKSDLSQLSSEGVAYIQIDAPRYSYYLDPKWRSWIRKELETDPDAALDEALRADN